MVVFVLEVITTYELYLLEDVDPVVEEDEEVVEVDPKEKVNSTD